ncbi:MAG: alpha-galactosidase [Eubacterium sp.]|nr:alpha-galactosidase [Eubacterium sp.]
MTFLIVIITILIILIVLFISWLLVMKANGKCPLCALKRIAMPRKITMDISELEDYDNGVAKTPPMGWSSWNTFRNHIDQDLIMEVANAMVDSGLAEAGYKYINLDDCWQSSMRDSEGKLQGDLRTFSRGIPQLIKDINKLGLKVGLYSSNGTLTCEDMPASLGNEELDAKTLASWGCEFFKYDFCHSQPISGDCPAIEKIELNRIDSQAFDSIEVLKPEDAEFTGRAKVIKLSELPSGKAIGFINHGAGSATFRVITLPKGKYALTVVHQKTFKRHYSYAQITVNGKVHEIFFPPGKGFSDSGRTQLVVDLKDGENVITIQNPIATVADSSFIQYKRMGDALKNATKQWARFTNTDEKPIVYSICEWGTAKPWDWGRKAGNMWRTTHDILPVWSSVRILYSFTVGLYKHAGPGGWNDPDMLEVGNGKLTENENKAHFSLWCMMAAPLMLGNDIRKLVDGNNNAVEGNSVLKIVTNKQLIAIDQDALGKPAKIVKKITGVDVLARPLSNGDVALCLFNKSIGNKNVHFELSDLLDDEYLNMSPASQYELHDLWTDERNTASAISVSLPKHSVKVYRIKSI